MDPIRFRTKGVDFGMSFGRTSFGSSERGQTFQHKRYQAPKKPTSFVLEKMLSQTKSNLGVIMKTLITDPTDFLLDEASQLEHLIQQLKGQIEWRKYGRH